MPETITATSPSFWAWSTILGEPYPVKSEIAISESKSFAALIEKENNSLGFSVVVVALLPEMTYA